MSSIGPMMRNSQCSGTSTSKTVYISIGITFFAQHDIYRYIVHTSMSLYDIIWTLDSPDIGYFPDIGTPDIGIFRISGTTYPI